MSLKPGYIELFIDTGETFIMDSHGFSFATLEQIKEQIEEIPESLDNYENNTIAVVSPERQYYNKYYENGYVSEEFDGYLFEQDEYCKKKTQELREEMMQMMKEGDSFE